MNKLELQKKANEVRNGIIDAVHAATSNTIDACCLSAAHP